MGRHRNMLGGMIQHSNPAERPDLRPGGTRIRRVSRGSILELDSTAVRADARRRMPRSPCAAATVPGPDPRARLGAPPDAAFTAALETDAVTRAIEATVELATGAITAARLIPTTPAGASNGVLVQRLKAEAVSRGASAAQAILHKLDLTGLDRSVAERVEGALDALDDAAGAAEMELEALQGDPAILKLRALRDAGQDLDVRPSERFFQLVDDIATVARSSWTTRCRSALMVTAPASSSLSALRLRR